MRGKTDKELELCRRSLNLIERFIPEWYENPSNEEISRLTRDLRAFFAEEDGDKREQSPEEKEMTFGEFVRDITREMEKNGWDEDKPILFNTCDSLDLYYLSIYERDGKICIDVGDEDD